MQSSVTRRDFVKAAGLLLPSTMACLHSPTDQGSREGDPRLTARPGTPSETPTIGESRLELGFPDGLMYVPASYDPDTQTPLLVALHGATRSSLDWAGLYDVCESRGYVLLAPDSRDRTWDRVNGFFGPDVQYIDAALAHVFARVRVNPDRIGLLGFSDGASYALSLGPSNGDLFKAIIAFSPGFLAPGTDLVGTPRFWVSHGTSDTILSSETTRTQIIPALLDAGYDVTHVEYEGGHELPPSIATQALDWFDE